VQACSRRCKVKHLLCRDSQHPMVTVATQHNTAYANHTGNTSSEVQHMQPLHQQRHHMRGQLCLGSTYVLEQLMDPRKARHNAVLVV
jgi:hypothetical protein